MTVGLENYLPSLCAERERACCKHTLATLGQPVGRTCLRCAVGAPPPAFPNTHRGGERRPRRGKLTLANRGLGVSPSRIP